MLGDGDDGDGSGGGGGGCSRTGEALGSSSCAVCSSSSLMKLELRWKLLLDVVVSAFVLSNSKSIN